MSIKGRKITRTTQIYGKILRLILPGDAKSEGILRLRGLLEKNSEILKVLENPNPDEMESANGPVVLIGNLADSRCVEKLYHLFLCATDKWYPGPSGYEIRTLLDPFGTGFNIIHIGYSDASGCEKAVERFIRLIGGEIPYISEINAQRLQIPGEYAAYIDNDILDSAKDTYFYSIRPENKGYLAYLTGDAKVLGEYEKAMTQMREMPFNHLMLYNRYTVWRLLEVTGMLDENLSGEYAGIFHDWISGPEGIGAIQSHQYQSPHLARNNHGLIPALGIKMFCGYLKTYHPEIKETGDYERLADNVFLPYLDGSWKPQCDGLCHGWWLSQPILLHYGLADPEKRYFANGGARKAAECALAAINNMGWLPAAGDAVMSRQHPGFSLRVAAAYYRDGRYMFGNDILPFEYACSGEMSAMHRRFDTGLAPVEPEAGAAVIPMDRLVYETWSHEDEHHSVMVSDTPPSVPLEKCFDKISLRSGWNPDDEFMLVDGLGGGGHSYADAGAILEYSAYGIPFLVSEDRLFYVEPENHNMVTICRDGVRQPIPAFPSIEAFSEHEDGTIYLRILSKNNNGADWTREIYFIPGMGAAVRDHIEAREDGEYSIEVHFRTPGSVMTKEDGFISIKENENGRFAFILTGLNDDDTGISFIKQGYGHLFRTPPGKEKPEFEGLDDRALFMNRYRVKLPEITSYTAKRNIRLEKGESVAFTHFMTAGREDERPAAVSSADEGLRIERNDRKKTLVFDKKAVTRNTGEEVLEPAMDFFADLLYEGRSDFISFEKNSNGYVAGTAGGDICVFGDDGELLWEAREDGPVFAVCTDKGILYAGIGNNTIVSYKNGYRLWTRRYERIPTMYYWWELETPRVVSIKAAGGLVFAGCGDNHIRCLSEDGDEKWTYYYRASVPAVFEILDIDGDGEKEIIVSGGLFGAYSQIEVITMEGRLKFRPNPSIGSGWTSYTTSMKVLQKSGEGYIIHGVNRNNNFEMFKYTGSGTENHFTPVFSHRLAGAVTALCEDEGTIYTGTSLGFLSAYGMDGSRKWIVPLHGGIRYISKTKEGLLAMEADGTMYRLSETGEIRTISMDAISTPRIAEDEERLFIIHGKGIYGVRKEADSDEF
ncbi:MAG: hypothetical protein JXB33_09200 [Clostridia bacterium]|nr:hypothetical protein [Clostridia bacterium]